MQKNTNKSKNRINTFEDSLFKYMMCHEKNRDMVVDLINALTGIKKEEIYNATFIGGGEIPKKRKTQKKQSTDFTIKFKNSCIIMECNQFKYEKNIFEKNTTYVFSRQATNTYSKTEKYPQTILINVDNFNKYNTKRPILIFEILERYEHFKETNLYTSVHLVIENFKNKEYDIDEEIIKFSKLMNDNTSIKELKKIFKGDEKYMQVVDTIGQFTLMDNGGLYYDKEERIAYEKEMIKIGYFEEGQKDGAKQEKIEIAKSLLNYGMPIEDVAKNTNLSIREIKNLKNK